MRKPLFVAVVSVLSLALIVLTASRLLDTATLADTVRPETITATVSIEGEETPLDLKLFVAPADWPTRFSTYYSDDFAVETSRTLEGSSVRFTANFGGILNPNAFIEIFLFPPGTEQPEIDAKVKLLTETYKLKPDQGDRYLWSMAEYSVTVASSAVINLAVGTWEGQPLYVLTHYPAEYGDGFGPRAASILQEWQWGN